MQTLIIIVSSLSERGETTSKRVKNLLSEIISYVGKRLIKDMPEENTPGIFLNHILSDEDKNAIVNMSSDDDYIMFVEGDEENFDKYKNYMNCSIE